MVFITTAALIMNAAAISYASGSGEATDDFIVDTPHAESATTSPETKSEQIKPEEIKSQEDAQAVEVEKTRPHTAKKRYKVVYDYSVPYRDRRETIGWTFGFQWVHFDPSNYQPSFSTQNFENYYGPGSGLYELNFGMKVNFVLGSIGPQITAGYFSTQNSANNATLSIIPITAGITYYMDSIFPEPYIVPYGTFGGYTGIYNESVSSSGGAGTGLSAKGNSAFAMFYAVGLEIRLDGLDQITHETAYDEYGLENTFIFAEMRSFLPSAIGTGVPNLSTPLQLAGGLKLEF